jgi:hypothetical protein
LARRKKEKEKRVLTSLMEKIQESLEASWNFVFLSLSLGFSCKNNGEERNRGDGCLYKEQNRFNQRRRVYIRSEKGSINIGKGF